MTDHVEHARPGTARNRQGNHVNSRLARSRWPGVRSRPCAPPGWPVIARLRGRTIRAVARCRCAARRGRPASRCRGRAGGSAASHDGQSWPDLRHSMVGAFSTGVRQKCRSS
jgi:hypothetical protein